MKSLLVLSAIFIIAGFFHFIFPTPYLKIMPRWVPAPKWANWVSGGLEIAFGIAIFFPKSQSIAAWGIIVLLIAVYPANWRHYKLTKGTKMEIITLIRLPLQLLLIWWVFQYT